MNHRRRRRVAMVIHSPGGEKGALLGALIRVVPVVGRLLWRGEFLLRARRHDGWVRGEVVRAEMGVRGNQAGRWKPVEITKQKHKHNKKHNKFQFNLLKRWKKV